MEKISIPSLRMKNDVVDFPEKCKNTKASGEGNTSHMRTIRFHSIL